MVKTVCLGLDPDPAILIATSVIELKADETKAFRELARTGMVIPGYCR
jgi:hypothetical protein